MSDAPKKGRTILSLDGTWQVAESNERNSPPASFGHEAPVPGLLHSATPAFADIGKFESREVQYNRTMMPLITGGRLVVPVDEAAKAAPRGISYQPRDYFWYRRRFTAPAARMHASLTVLKAQFGSEVWVNGQKVGERDSCFTAGTYDVSGVIRWGAENEIVIRIGAHPAVLPPGNTTPYDFEKEYWTPGIWDSVELHCFDGPAIDGVQVAPRIAPREIIVETDLRNPGTDAAEVLVEHVVRDPGSQAVLATYRTTIEVGGAATETHRCTIALPDAELWSPDTPKLYVLETTTPGDSVQTRFGVREFRFDTPTKRAYLNGELIFLRGGGACLSRFFEDPMCGTLPWNEAWVRKLLVDNPKLMNWNTVKFTIGPVPRKWMEVADEAGLLVIPEFPVWVLSPKIFFGYDRDYDRAALKQEMKDWVRDNRNHPSVIHWNSSLESVQDWMGKEIVSEVRETDLSGRAWQNSWNPAVGPDDPYEDHPYEFSANGSPARPPFDMMLLEDRAGFEKPHLGATPTGHATYIAEYGWLWLNRDGSPTLLTQFIYPTLPFPVSTKEERLRTVSYLLAGLTEYWRSYRHLAGVMYYGYLASSNPGISYTSDYFADIEKPEFHDIYREYVSDAFSPLGVYVNFWQRQLEAGTEREFFVMLCNDLREARSGRLALTIETGGSPPVTLAEEDFFLAPWGQQTVRLDVMLPQAHGAYTLKAVATADDGSSTTSRRWLELGDNPQAAEAPKAASFGQQFNAE